MQNTKHNIIIFTHGSIYRTLIEGIIGYTIPFESIYAGALAVIRIDDDIRLLEFNKNFK